MTGFTVGEGDRGGRKTRLVRTGVRYPRRLVDNPWVGAEVLKILDRRGKGSGKTTLVGDGLIRRPSRPSTETVFAPGVLVAGRYRVIRMVGSGGCGHVYEALDTGLGDVVALKTVRANMESSPLVVERFRREVQNARKVTHANVCRIFDLGIENSQGHDRFFLTMEMLTGTSLAERLESGPRYEAGEALAVIAQIADGLQAAHDAGVVHRDLKPANIMLLAPPSGKAHPRAVITDFGIAISQEQDDTRLTQSGEIVGTPEYMAPERADSGPVLPSSDIYSLGLVLYEMLTLQRPFDPSDTLLGTVLRRRREAPRPLRQFVPDIDPVWEATVLRCLEREPTQRFSRAADVALALSGSGSRPAFPAGGRSPTGPGQPLPRPGNDVGRKARPARTARLKKWFGRSGDGK